MASPKSCTYQLERPCHQEPKHSASPPSPSLCRQGFEGVFSYRFTFSFLVSCMSLHSMVRGFPADGDSNLYRMFYLIRLPSVLIF
jgi:hypothetical protein